MTPTCKPHSLRRLPTIFEQFRDNWNKIYEELEKLRSAHHERQQGADLRPASEETDAVLSAALSARLLRRRGTAMRTRSARW